MAPSLDKMHHQKNCDQYRLTLCRAFSKRRSGSCEFHNVLPIKKLEETNTSPLCGSMGEITQSHKGMTYRSGANHRGPLSRLAPKTRKVRPTFERNSRTLTEHRRGIVFPGLPIVGETRMKSVALLIDRHLTRGETAPTCLPPDLFDAISLSPTPQHVIRVGCALVSQVGTRPYSASGAPHSTRSDCGHWVCSKAHRSR